MATIVLEPEESFEHTHIEDSYTELIEGSVDLIMEDSSIRLNVNEPILTRSGVKHRMVNLGTSPASVRCAHAPAPPHSMH
jgi:mannose-6-phosphate isomerase-like protein (cupin superfamily)